MNFRIANTFTDSLSKLTNDEQKAVKTTVFDLQINPANPGIRLHKVDKARDKNFWSVSVNKDLRLIVHKTTDSFLICYVDHHDQAYSWAQRRKIEAHPKTGAAQIIEVRETVNEIEIPRYVETESATPQSPILFHDISDEELSNYGIPDEWLKDVKTADENRLMQLVDYLPEEASEALLKLAIGEKPEVPQPLEPVNDPFDHPDAQRRFRTMENMEELERALQYPWERWSIFLHPEQSQLVEQNFSGPARVSGSAGTGKTVVALHRAVSLARRNPDARVLLTTFSDNLASLLKEKLNRLISFQHEPKLKERLEVHAMDNIGLRLYEYNFGKASLTSSEEINELLSHAAKKVDGHKFSLQFLLSEWDEIVDARQINSWEEYRNVQRLGRKTRLPEKQRAVLWKIFDQVQKELLKRGWATYAGLFFALADKMNKIDHPPFDFAVVDESQDINIPQLVFLAALGKNKPNSLFFAGDLGQRIFQQPFSWKALGVDIRGRSSILKINYRTTHQIRMQADRLLNAEISDVDGNTEIRKETISVFNGPSPKIEISKNEDTEIEAVASWIRYCQQDNNVLPHEIGVFVRTSNELPRAEEAIKKAGLNYIVLNSGVESKKGNVSLSTMHLAKGMEFKAVIVMACDEEVLPFQQRIEKIGDDTDLEEVYNTERNLLYVACTRARDYLFVSGVEPASEFLEDLVGS